MTRRVAAYTDEVLFVGSVALVGTLAVSTDLEGTELAAYVGVSVLGVGLAALFVRSWVREWRRAGELAERAERTGTEK